MKKFTLIEMLVVIAIIGILASTLMPSLSKARDKAKQAVCASNQKSIGLAMTMYLDDQNGRTAKSATDGGVHIQWRVDIMGYLNLPYATWSDKSESAASKVFQCPSADTLSWGNEYQNTGIGYNRLLDDLQIAIVGAPSETLMNGDTTDWGSASWYDMMLLNPSRSAWVDPPVGDRHNKGINSLWVDGHVSWSSQNALRSGKNNEIDYFYLPEK